MQKYLRTSGFTLIEISMVMVIIALIIGGIVFGRDMIRQAEVRSILADSEKIQAAIYAFQKKYDYWPGDFPRAESYWGPDASCPLTTSNTDPKVETCNGDGNGRLNAPSGGQVCAAAGNYEQEPYRLWQHLANAEMFPDQFPGVEGTGGVLHGVPGVNIPASAKLDGVGFQLMNFGGESENFDWLTGVRFSNVLFIGKEDKTTDCLEPVEPFLFAAEAYNLDTKIDDGAPGTGNLRVYSDNSALCADSNTPATAAYAANDSTQSCALLQIVSW